MTCDPSVYSPFTDTVEVEVSTTFLTVKVAEVELFPVRVSLP